MFFTDLKQLSNTEGNVVLQVTFVPISGIKLMNSGGKKKKGKKGLEKIFDIFRKYSLKSIWGSV